MKIIVCIKHEVARILSWAFYLVVVCVTAFACVMRLLLLINNDDYIQLTPTISPADKKSDDKKCKF